TQFIFVVSISAGSLSDKAAEKCRRYQQLACCFGILCVLLFNNLTATSTALENKITTLTAENQDLKIEKKNLTEVIKNMEKTWNEQNVSRAQWSVDQYCPKENNGRSCTSCQKGWEKQISSCYAYNDAKPSDQRNWEGAREDCSTKNSDLTVVLNQTQKVIEPPVIDGIKGYWIGLRAEGGKWRWIDGSDLTNQDWIQQQPAVDGQCVTSLQDRGWESVSCDEKNGWICEKKALSV
uniref:C-type lectin domain family 17, member A-like n=1 Tax=Fundulus heteroclitus TaxID=8078 RepID=A0A3Q2R1Q2_FUNHE